MRSLGLRAAIAELRSDGSVALLLAVSLGWFLTIGVRTIYPALLPAITDDFGVGTATAGLFIALLWTPYAIMQFPSGAIADAVGERLVLVGSLALTVAGVCAIFLSTTLALFVGATVLLGVGTGSFGTTRLTVVAVSFDRMETTAISVSQAAGNIGNVAMTAAAGLVSVYAGWRWGFGYAVPLLALSALTIWVFVPKMASETTDGEPFGRTMRTVLSTIRRPRVMAVTALLTADMIIYQIVTGFLPIYLVDMKGLTTGTAATVYSLFYAGAIGLQFVSGIVADRRGNRVAIATFLGLSVPAFVLLVVARSFPVILLSVVLLSSVLGSWPPVNAVAIDALPEAIQGSAFGLLRTFYTIVGAVGPPVVGLMAAAGLFDLAFLLLAGLAAATAVFGLYFQRIGQPA